MTITANLLAIIASHGAWARGECGGQRANLIGAKLRSADLRNANFRSANLYGANLSCTDLRSADLRNANFRSANLYGANLRSADLSCADLRSANFRSANLYGADLSSADLRSADLRSANLNGANLRRAYGIVDAGYRGDGYRFVGYLKNSVITVQAGCRNLTMTQAREHWLNTRGNTPLGDETMSMLDHIERGMVSCRLV